jgi:branched-chain amino acid aminotransferase
MEQAVTQKQYNIRIEKTTRSRIAEVDFDNIPFGRVFSDHMFSAEYDNGEWKNLRIEPFGKVSYNPAMSSLHYGQLIFEGLKAYKDNHNNITLFRHLKNHKRFNRSAHRMAMPQVPQEVFEEGLKALLKLDKDWVPDKPGSSLYIRPFMFATDEYVGIKPSQTYRFMIFTCPVGPYYEHPVKVKVAEKYVRAFKGGTGFAKTAGNYAATLRPVIEAKEQGFDQILWLDGCNFEQVHEIGTMNVFFVIDGRVITPSMETGEILEGITRDSVVQICKAKGIPVEDRIIHIQEIINAYHDGKLEEVFGAGTAATIAQIAELGYKGEHMILPPIEDRKISTMVREELVGIKRGIIEDTFGWTTKI